MNDLIIGSLIGVGGVLGGSALTGYLNWRTRRSDHEAEERRREADRAAQREERFVAELTRVRDEGAITIARVRSLLSEIHPEGATFNFNPIALEETTSQFWTTWREVRDPLGVLAVKLPTLEGRELTDQLRVAVHNSVNRVTRLLTLLARNEDLDDLDGSKEDWMRADDLAKQLRETLHQTGPEPSSSP